MPLFPPQDTNAFYFSMTDLEHPWSRHEIKPFQLDGKQWNSIEHYYQAMKFDSADYRERIRLAKTIKEVEKLGKSFLRRKRVDWKAIKTTVMTRAIYTQCRTYEAMAKSLLETNDEKLIESSQFDYFWGCGRDRRGDNHYGKILMNIRTKLQEESLEECNMGEVQINTGRVE